MKPKVPVGYQLTSLAPLIRHFTGLHLTVETKSGKHYRGELKEADDYMNLVLSCTPTTKRTLSNVSDSRQKDIPIYHKEASTNSPIKSEEESYRIVHIPIGRQEASKNPPIKNEEKSYRMVHIRGPSIRFVHFPDNADLPALIRMGINRKRTVENKYARGKRSKR
jgi:small nuclear ribonucleoprotein (snRNP)-like protein